MTGRLSIWSFGAPFQGSGASTCSAGVALALARGSRTVVLADCDPGGGGFDDLFGIKEARGGLDAFLDGVHPSLEAALTDSGVEGLKLLSNASRLPEIVDPACPFRAALTHALLDLKADCLIADLGASSSPPALDFNAVAARPVLVCTGETGSMQGVYDHLKGFVFRRLARLFADDPFISETVRSSTGRGGAAGSLSDLCERIASADERAAARALAELKRFSFPLLLNKAAGPDAAPTLDALSGAARTILGLNAPVAGAVRLHPTGDAVPFAAAAEFDAAAEIMREFRAAEASAPAARAEAVAEAVVQRPAAGPFESFGFNDNVKYMDRIFHVQTEVYGGVHPRVETAIYQGGRVYLSKKSEWRGTDAAELKAFAGRQHAAAVAAVKTGRVLPAGLG